MIGRNVLTQKIDPFKMELKYISSRKRPFCWFIHSLCRNQNIPMRESPLPHIERKCLPIIALNFSYYEFFISIHSWLILAMIAKNRKLGFLLTLKQISRINKSTDDFVFFQRTNFNRYSHHRVRIIPRMNTNEKSPSLRVYCVLKQAWYPPLDSLGILRSDPRDWNPRLKVSFQVGFA